MKTRRGALYFILLGVLWLPGCDGGQKGGGPSAAPSGSAGVAATALTIRLQPARVGRRAKEVRKATQKLAVEFWNGRERVGTTESSRIEAHARTTEVLGLVGRAPAKVKVTYDRYQHEERRFDGKSEPVPRLAGRTFVVDATDGTVKVESGDGAPVTPDEETTLKSLHAGLGKEDPVVLALGKRPIAVGKAAPLREPLFQALVASKSGALKEGGTVTLEGLASQGGRELGTFSWKAVMTSKEDNGLEITWHLRGQFVVAVSECMLLESTIDASLDVAGRSRQGGATIEMQGSGAMQTEEVVTLL